MSLTQMSKKISILKLEQMVTQILFIWLSIWKQLQYVEAIEENKLYSYICIIHDNKKC